jgi:hypothetical protein
MKRASGPARSSARWRKEVDRARERLDRGFLAALVHGGLLLLGAGWMALRSPPPAATWAMLLGVAGALALLGWLTKKGYRIAPALLLAGVIGPFLHSLVFRPGLHVSLAAIVFAWFYFEGLRGTLALRRLGAPAQE